MTWCISLVNLYFNDRTDCPSEISTWPLEQSCIIHEEWRLCSSLVLCGWFCRFISCQPLRATQQSSKENPKLENQMFPHKSHSVMSGNSAGKVEQLWWALEKINHLSPQTAPLNFAVVKHRRRAQECFVTKTIPVYRHRTDAHKCSAISCTVSRNSNKGYESDTGLMEELWYVADPLPWFRELVELIFLCVVKRKLCHFVLWSIIFTPAATCLEED